MSLTHYTTFHPGWAASFPQKAIGGASTYFGSRLFPRANFLDPSSALFNSTFAAWKGSVDAGLFTVSFQIGAPLLSTNEPNAVNPAWRKTVLHSMQFASWNLIGNSTLVQDQEIAARKLLYERQDAWKAVSPGAGAYLGEADRCDIGWQQSFYGDGVYERLLAVKKSVDPGQLFWQKTGVGSEGWDVRSQNPVGDENGPLCRV